MLMFVGTSLFLSETPLPRRTLLALEVSGCKFGPKYSRLDFYQAPLRIEADDLIEPRHVDQDHVVAKLLASHSMTPTRYRQWLLGTFCCKHRRLEFFDAFRPEDAVDTRAIELRVDVIHYLGIVHSAESQLRTEVESCRSGEELPSIDQLIDSPDLRVSRAARNTINDSVTWRTS
jgi:hypothetical protein